jgi:putative Mg2+ transporter-C (MgtC) family protein
MQIVVEELTAGLADPTELVRILIRVVAATILGAIIGWERERMGKPAGLRTHMLVSLGSALFVLAAAEAGMALGDLSRVIQGLAAGIGFIGGGAILKLPEEHQIDGLTTAAGIWLTAAVGVAVGMGRVGTALLSLVLGWLIVVGVGYLEYQRVPRPTSPLDRSDS